MKNLLSIILTLAMLLSTATVIAENDEIKVILDDERIEFDVMPIIENDRTLVPMRAIAEALGAEVEWKSPRVVMRVGEKKTVGLVINSNEMSVDTGAAGAKKVILDVPAKIVNDRTLVPLRAVSEAFECTVDWDGDTRTVTISSTETLPKTNVPVEVLEPVEAEGTYIQKLMANIPNDKNTVISPFSLKIAMMMAANGAKGETQKEILDVFGVDSVDEFNEYILSKINSYQVDDYNYYSQDEAIGKDEVKIANSIWFNKDYYNNVKFSEKFTDVIKKYYDGTAEEVTNNTYASEVNDWVHKKTNGRIPTIMSDSDSDETLLSIVNTIYMKAKWWLEFDEKDTKKDVFTDIDGNEVITDFMNQKIMHSYYEDDDTKMVKLEYQNGFSMWIVLGDDTDFLSKKNKAEGRTVKLSMPKFKIEYAVDYSKLLQSMGANKAFANSNGDFNGMLENVPENIKINSVLQRTIIDVDEKGTEAAAITEIDLAGLGRGDEAEFKADRPFSYYILDDTSTEILFAGRYVKCETGDM